MKQYRCFRRERELAERNRHRRISRNDSRHAFRESKIAKRIVERRSNLILLSKVFKHNGNTLVVELAQVAFCTYHQQHACSRILKLLIIRLKLAFEIKSLREDDKINVGRG